MPKRSSAALELAESLVARGGGGSAAKESTHLALATEVLAQRKHVSAMKWRCTNLQKQLQKERAARARLEARLARAERVAQSSTTLRCEGCVAHRSAPCDRTHVCLRAPFPCTASPLLAARIHYATLVES